MLFNLSEEIFMESIIYLQNYALDYFEIIRANLDKLDEVVLQVSHFRLFIICNSMIFFVISEVGKTIESF